MPLAYRWLFPGLWISWCLYWFWASRYAKPDERRESPGSRLLHTVPLAFAVWLLASTRIPFAVLNDRMFPWSPWQFWIAAIITASGFFFTVWARVYLGRNWSGIVTIKHDHELIDAGPYAIVRHPIYTGLIVAVVGSALAWGQWRGVLAVVIAWAALWRKLRVEERWLTDRFGERYVEYCRRVPALVPFTKARQA